MRSIANTFFSALFVALTFSACHGNAPPRVQEFAPAPNPSAAIVPVAPIDSAPISAAVPAPAPPASKFRVVKNAFVKTHADDPFCSNALPEPGEQAMRPPTIAAPHEIIAKKKFADDDTANAICTAALGDEDSGSERSCVVTIQERSGDVARVLLTVTSGSASMQSREEDVHTLNGAIRIDTAARTIVSARFTGKGVFRDRTACEKGCEEPGTIKCRWDRKLPGCPARCYCPFTECGRSTIETSFGDGSP